MSEPKILENVYPGLESIWKTPHVCGHCISHIGEDWLFCPYYGNEFYTEEELEELVKKNCGG